VEIRYFLYPAFLPASCLPPPPPSFEGWMEGWMDGWMDGWVDRMEEDTSKIN